MAAIEYFFRVVITSSKHRGAGAWYGRILESHASRVYITVLDLVIRVRRTRRRYILRLTLLTDICYRLLSLDDSILVSLLQPYQVWLNLPVKRWMQRYCKSESHDKKVQPNWNRFSLTSAMRRTGTTKLQMVPFCTDNQQLYNFKISKYQSKITQLV